MPLDIGARTVWHIPDLKAEAEATTDEPQEMTQNPSFGGYKRHYRALIMEMQEEDGDEDEPSSSTPMRPEKRARLGQHIPARKEAVQIIDGAMTPVTDTEAKGRRLLDDASRDRRRAAKVATADEPTRTSRLVSPEPLLGRSRPLWREVSDEEVNNARSKTARVRPAGTAYPRWMYQGYKLPAVEHTERRAVDILQRAYDEAFSKSGELPEHTYFQLDFFTVYHPSGTAWHSNELVTLEKLTMARKGTFWFSGVVSFGSTRCFVKDVPFDILTLEYGDARPWHDRICIQSKMAQAQNFYYKLGKPASEYQRFYAPFLTVAQFTDYFIEYMCDYQRVTIARFRRDFWIWLQDNYADDASFQTWHDKIRLRDFKTLVSANVEWLFKECWSIDGQSAGTEDETGLLEHPLWEEVHPERLKAIPAQRVNYAAKTVVTPYAFDCFRSMYFSDMLGPHTIVGNGLRTQINGLKGCLGLTPLRAEICPPSTSMNIPQPKTLEHVADVKAGDVVVVDADRTGDWKLSTTAFWYAYVQRIWQDRNGQRRLNVLWLYQPADTTIGSAFYPFSRELFLSDNCGCGKKEALHLNDVEDIAGTVDVSWFVQDPDSVRGFFVRRTFRTVPELNQYDFVALEKRHFRCCHRDEDEEITESYGADDTVLVSMDEDSCGRNCEPAVIVGLQRDELEEWFHVQRLAYAIDTGAPYARPNELVVTDEMSLRSKDDIVRRCHIRFFSHEEIAAGDVPTPYNRDGTGDYFYIAQDPDKPLHEPVALRQGWDPRQTGSKPQLSGLGIFCGGGNFDRGLEEGGSVKFRYAVDLAEKALHSYRANDADPDSTKYYLGSVNEYLKDAMDSSNSELVAQPGVIDVISAGSPCQGFSRMQRDQHSEQSRRNASMVASVVSFVDLYAPRYLVLENVVAMTHIVKGLGSQNVFSQMIAALVGLGYQVQQFLIDSYYHGSSQGRSRVFILATAPSCAILNQPEYTHALAAGLERQCNLGKCTNGKPFGSRRSDAYTPFAQVSAQESVCDLPYLDDSQTFLCPSHPDHRPATEETSTNRLRLSVVPKRPHGMSLVNAVQAGVVRGEPLEFSMGRNRIKCGPMSKSYSRVYPDRPFPTIITKLSPGDGIAGRVVHWDQDRVLTIMEARRGQGFPDYEVLIGSVVDRLRICGNSVDRKVALVLGLSLRESWLKSPPVLQRGARHRLSSESVIEISSAGRRDAEAAHADSRASRSNLSARLDTAQADDEGAAPTDVTMTYGGVEPTSRPNDLLVDNRAVKMALNLSEQDLEEIRQGGFRRINEILHGFPARHSLHEG